MKLFVITTVVGATGLVIKGLKKSGNNTRKRSIDSLQKTAVPGTSHMIRKVLQSGIWSLSGGCTIGSRGEVRGEGKYVIRDDYDDDNGDSCGDVTWL